MLIIFGLLAAMLTTVSFVPQVLKIWKTKHTKDLSLLMYLIFFTGVLCWLTYGILIKDIPVIAANSVTFLLVLSVLVMKIRYG